MHQHHMSTLALLAYQAQLYSCSSTDCVLFSSKLLSTFAMLPATCSVTAGCPVLETRMRIWVMVFCLTLTCFAAACAASVRVQLKAVSTILFRQRAVLQQAAARGRHGDIGGLWKQREKTHTHSLSGGESGWVTQGELVRDCVCVCTCVFLRDGKRKRECEDSSGTGFVSHGSWKQF